MGRAEICRRFLQSFKNTLPAKADVLLYVPGDDPTLSEYEALRGTPEVKKFIIGANLGGYAPTLQALWKMFPDYSYYLSMEDDCILLDQGWDKHLIETYTRAFYPHDLGLIQLVDESHEVRCQFVSRKWTELLGYFMYPPLREHGVKALHTLAENLKLNVWALNARVRHKGEWRGGYSNGKVEWMSSEAAQRYHENDARFEQYMWTEYPTDEMIILQGVHA
jgi:hypothetical protein